MVVGPRGLREQLEVIRGDKRQTRDPEQDIRLEGALHREEDQRPPVDAAERDPALRLEHLVHAREVLQASHQKG